MKLPEYNNYRANEPLHDMSSNSDPLAETKTTFNIVFGGVCIVATFALIGYGVISLLRTIF